MGREKQEEKVKFFTKDNEKISWSKLMPYVMAEKDGGYDFIDTPANKALLSVVSRETQIIATYVEGRYYVNCESMGVEPPIEVSIDLIDVERGIEESGNPYTKMKLYNLHLEDDSVVMGMYTGTRYTKKGREITVTTLGMEKHSGVALSQLTDSELAAFEVMDRFDYYGQV